MGHWTQQNSYRRKMEFVSLLNLETAKLNMLSAPSAVGKFCRYVITYA